MSDFDQGSLEDLLSQLSTKVRQLTDRINGLVDGGYVQHKPKCGVNKRPYFSMGVWRVDCTCGLSAVLKHEGRENPFKR